MSKNSLVKIIACIALLAIPISVFASDYTLDAMGNSEEEIVYKSSNNDDFDNEMKIFVEIPSPYRITIPKKLVISGATKKANYCIDVDGDLSDTASINVIPDDTIEFRSSRTVKMVQSHKTKQNG